METAKRKSMHEIIDETVEFYSNNPRSLAEGYCLYLHPNGYQCAYARMITNPEVLKEGKSCNSGGNETAKVIFKPGYGGHPLDFYAGIQQLHDYDDYWKSTSGLSETGQVAVLKLKQQFNEN